MPIKHGVYVSEDATVMPNTLTGQDTIVVIGSAPIYQKDNYEELLNTPILCRSSAEAKEMFGYNSDFQKFTLCQMMWITENLFPISPVVYIAVPNVLAPTYAPKTASINNPVPETYTFSDLYVIKSKTTFKQGSTDLVENRDYTVEYNEAGNMIVTFITGTGSSFDSSANVAISYCVQDVNTTDAAIIGEYNSQTGVAKGAELIQFVYPRLGVVPTILCAPKYSKNSAVGAALYAKAANINGVFKAFAVLDLESTTTRTYTGVSAAKETAGYTSPYCYPVWPCAKVSGSDSVMNFSAIAAALMAYTDANNDGVPSRSPSNRIVGRGGSGVVATCLEDGTEIVLTQDQATTINSYGVNTALNMNGWRLFGSYTGAYPYSSEVKDIWAPVLRMFNWQGNNFIQIYFDKVDDPLNAVLIESIVDAENVRCAAFAPDHWAGAEINYYATDNPTANLLAGKIIFRQRIAPYTPAQEIDNILSYDVTMLTEVMNTITA